MKIYTKSGDDGQTGLLGPGRVSKSSPRVAAYGAVDELNALIGVARTTPLDDRADSWLNDIQNDLFVVGSALADSGPNGRFQDALDPARATALETAIDTLDAELPPLTTFLLPGGSQAGAVLHLARTVCRRAEREVVALGLIPGESVAGILVVYLNRLSDFLFVLARAMNARAGVAEVPWLGL